MKSKIVLSFLGAAMLVGSIAVSPGYVVAAESSVSDLPQNIGKATENAVDYVGDAALTAKIKGLFLAEKGLDSMDISVTTMDGAVQLSGTVDNESQKTLAEKIAKNADGVKSVENKIVVANMPKAK